MIEDLKHRRLAKSAEVRRYDQRSEQFKQNRIFDFDQKKIYAELNGGRVRLNDVPNAKKSKGLWGDIF